MIIKVINMQMRKAFNGDEISALGSRSYETSDENW